MKEFQIALILGLGFSAVAQANGGTINFTGRIIPSTCSINLGKPDLTVALGDVPASALATPGARAGKKEFAIEVTGCSGGGTKVAARFESGNADPASGQLKLDASSEAGGVQIAIYDESDGLNKFGEDVPATSLRTLSGGAATLRYSAWYVATNDPVSPGTANASATYTLVYE